MQVYEKDNFYRKPHKIQKLLTKFDNLIRAGDKDGAAEVKDKIAEYVGIVYTTSSKKVGKNVVQVPVTEFDEVVFSSYLHSAFTSITVGESIAFYNYSSHRYEFLNDNVYLSFFKEILDSIDAEVWNPRREKSFAVRFQRDIKTKLDRYEVPEGKVVFTNGILDVRDMSFQAGDHPEVITFHCTGYDFPIQDTPYNCPNFLKFVWSIFEDKQLISILQEEYGYVLAVGINKSEKLFIWDGGGRNGKSINQSIIELMCGSENVGSVSLSQILSRFGPHAVYNKTVNFCAENDNVVYQSGFIKTVTGQDRVYVDVKNKEGYEAKIIAKMFIVTNGIFFNDRSRGLSERILALPYNFTFVPSPRKNTNERPIDVDLMSKLEPEIPQIALWALEGLQRLMRNKWQFTKSPKAESLKRKILQDSNPVLLFFDSCCTHTPGQYIKMSEAYSLFKEFATDNGVSVGAIVSANKFRDSFGSILEEHGLTKYPKRINGNDCYADITISL